MAMGMRLSIKPTPPLTAIVLCTAALLVLSFFIINAIWNYGNRKAATVAQIRKPVKFCIITSCIIFICWIPILLAGFPGFFNYDVGNAWLSQSLQVETGEYNAHHPILHTFFLGATMNIGQTIFGSYNAGIATSVISQALLLSALFGFSLKQMLDMGLSRNWAIGTVVYWAANPIVGMFAFSTTKDVIFSALVLLYVSISINVFKNGSVQTQAIKKIPIVLMSLLAMLIMVLRANAIVAIILTIPFVLSLIQKSVRKPFFIAMVTAVLLSSLWLGPISNLLKIEPSPIGSWNSLCVPIQQIAYVAQSDNISKEDRLAIEKIPDLSYNSQLSDTARKSFMKSGISKEDFFSLWAQIGIKYPEHYLKAFLLLTQDAWNPFAIIDPYSSGNKTTDVFEFKTKEPGSQHTKLPHLSSALNWISSERGPERIPLLGLAISIPFYLAVLCITFSRCILIKDTAAMASLALILLLAISNFFGPCMLIRYFLHIFFGFPLLLYLLFRPIYIDRNNGLNATEQNKPGSAETRLFK